MSNSRPPVRSALVGAKVSNLREMGRDQYERRVAAIEDLRRKHPDKSWSEIARMLSNSLVNEAAHE